MKSKQNIPLFCKLQITRLFKAFILLGAFFILPPQMITAQVLETNNKQSIEAVTMARDNIATNEYLIGVGDVLDIRVYNRPQLSREAIRVDGRGMIRMPLIESEIQASCRTESDLARGISKLYLEYLRSPHVEVFIKDFQSRPVAIIGAVREPGRFQLQRKVRLLELLAFAGGPTEEAGGRIQIIHGSSIQPCETVASEQETVAEEKFSSDLDENLSWYELKAVMNSGATENNNPFVRSGDIVNLIAADKIYVVGNVYRPITIPLKERVTLTQAIAMAGGTLPDTNFDKVRILRQTTADTTSKTELIGQFESH